jgi:ferredoxin
MTIRSNQYSSITENKKFRRLCDMLFYFSATGNSQHVAKRIATKTNESVIPITSCIKEQQYDFSLSENERLGIITPVYFWGLPSIVVDFITKINILTSGNHYTYSVITCGTVTGQAGKQIEKLLINKDIKVNAQFSIKMVDTWTPMFDLTNQEKNKIITEAAEPQIDYTIEKINMNQKGNFDNRKIPLISRFVYKYYRSIRQTKRFTLLDSCVGCGVCIKQCPDEAIKIIEGKVTWIKDECVMCLGCLHKCPKFSVQYGNKTQKHGQFLHPSK